MLYVTWVIVLGWRQGGGGEGSIVAFVRSPLLRSNSDRRRGQGWDSGRDDSDSIQDHYVEVFDGSRLSF
jgi:hypothetical protein